jgi:hypothetical protein
MQTLPFVALKLRRALLARSMEEVLRKSLIFMA